MLYMYVCYEIKNKSTQRTVNDCGKHFSRMFLYTQSVWLIFTLIYTIYRSAIASLLTLYIQAVVHIGFLDDAHHHNVTIDKTRFNCQH